MNINRGLKQFTPLAAQAIENSRLVAGRNNHLLQEELELIVWLLISEAFVAMFAAADYQPRNTKKKEK